MAWLYNGISLWGLPERDESTYPHTYIERDGDVYQLIASVSRLVKTSEGYFQFEGATNHLTWFHYDTGWGGLTEGSSDPKYDDIIWCDTDILDENGAVVLAATEPVYVPVNSKFNLVDFLSFFCLRLATVRTSFGILWDYNGVIRPKLPNWNKDEMPYAFIYTKKDDPTFTNLVTCSVKVVKTSTSFYSANGSVAIWYYQDKKWDKTIQGQREIDLDSDVYDIIWSNFDILNEDGSVYLAATEPKPI